MNSPIMMLFHRLFIFGLVFIVLCCTTTTTCLTVQFPRAFSQSSLTSADRFSLINLHNNNRIHCDFFTSTLAAKIAGRNCNLRLYSTPFPLDDDIQNQLEKARKLVEEAKAKIAAANEVKEKGTEVKSNVERKEKRDVVTKTKNEKTGLITTDGELMAQLSNEEDWEEKELMELFESESTGGRHDKGGKSIANRDMAASVFNMRLSMMDKDYRRVFDKRNRFIGEDN